MSLEAVIQRRRAERTALLDQARHFVAGLDTLLSLRAAVVFGSVARGDFNRWSDIDVLIMADNVCGDALERLDALGVRPPLVQPIAWTPQEWQARLVRRDPIAHEAAATGVWLVGSATELSTTRATAL